MSRHAAFAEKPVEVNHNENSQNAGMGQTQAKPGLQTEVSNSSLAPTGTRTTDPEKSSLSGQAFKAENAKATRKLLLKLGMSSARTPRIYV